MIRIVHKINEQIHLKMSLLESLIIVSEKAANIARSCRQEECLFNLLIQEKGSGEANPRFVQDFKTLADVLIQETVKYEIGRKASIQFQCSPYNQTITWPLILIALQILIVSFPNWKNP